MNKSFIFSIIIVILVYFAMNQGRVIKKSGDKINIAVSILPQKTFVEKVAGDLVDVTVLIPPGASPANYELTAKQLVDLENVDLYFSVGVPAEEKFEENIKAAGIKEVELDEIVSQKYEDRFFVEEQEEDEHEGEEHEDEEHHHHEGRDPHIWMSPKRVQEMVFRISTELNQIDSNNSDIYTQNRTDYINELSKLDKEIQNKYVDIQEKSFLIYHPALGYLADDYGIEMIALENEGKEASAKDIARIVDLAKEKNLKNVFYQEEFDSKQANLLAKELGGEAIKVSPLASNYIENIKDIINKINQ